MCLSTYSLFQTQFKKQACFNALWPNEGIDQTIALLLIGFNFENAIRAHKLFGSVSKRLLSHRSLEVLPCTCGCQVTILMSFAKTRMLYKN